MTPVAIESLAVPLRQDETGTLRVGDTRVTLDVLLDTYELEGTAEGVVRALDVLDLADVHAVLAWCLRHTEEVATYLRQREQEAEALERQLGAEGIAVSGPELKAKLLARKAQREAGNAPPGQ